MLLRAAHARSQVLEAIHVQSATTVAGREDALTFRKAFHTMNHLYLEGAAVILVLGLLGALTSRRQQAGWGVWYRYG